MRRIVHLSDLHFGRADCRLEAPLLAAIGDLAPDLVVVSGDLTQRARHSQFAAARAFLDRLPAPVLSVPGNHDTPLDNLLVRFLAPFGRYRQHIATELEPLHRDAEMIVAGVNSVNRFAWQQGRIGRGRLARLSARLSGPPGAGQTAPDDPLRVAVLHHPLEQSPDSHKRLMRGAGETLRALSDCGADLVLSGHLHLAAAHPFRAAPGLLFVQAGTGLSTRLRGGERNTFNQIDAHGPRLEVTTWAAEQVGAEARSLVFAPAARSDWQRGPEGWTALPTGILSGR